MQTNQYFQSLDGCMKITQVINEMVHATQIYFTNNTQSSIWCLVDPWTVDNTLRSENVCTNQTKTFIFSYAKHNSAD